MVFSTGVITFIFVRQSLKDQIEYQLSLDLGHTSHYLLNALDIFLLERLHDAQSNANLMWDTEALANHDMVNDFCCLVLDEQDIYSGIYLINSKGEEITFQSTTGEDFFRKHIRGHEKDFKKGISFIRDKYGHYTDVLFSSDIRDPEGITYGTLLLTMPIGELEKFLTESILTMNMGKDVAIELFDNQGLSVFSENNIRVKNTDYRKELISALVNHKDDSEKLIIRKDVVYFLSNEQGYHEFKGNHWHIFIGMSVEKAYAPLTKVDENALKLLGILLLITMIYALYIARMIALPFSKIAALIHNYSKLNFEYKIEIRGGRDFLELNDKILAMGQELNNRIQIQKEYYSRLAKQYSVVSSQKKEIEYQQEQIKSSIKYAQRIQNSLLPFKDHNDNRYANLDVYFTPLHEVSGDYYYIDRVTTSNGDDLHFYAIVDCTGHGVPGAFMSIIAHNLLYHAINSEKITEPDKILSYIDKSLNRFLSDVDSSKINDGMDVCLVTYNATSGTASFSGAYRPILFYNSSDKDITTIKGDKKSIGYKDPELFKNASTHYNIHKFHVNEGDRLIMFTDGITDQFGGPLGKKTGLKGFTRWIESCTDEVNFSKELFKKVDNWRRNYDQIDDMTILSIKFKTRAMVKNTQDKRKTPRFLTGHLKS